MSLVTFLSDYGLDDGFVGTCHGVIKRIAPETEIIDISHGIEPQNVLAGALVLAQALPYVPVGVHLAVVDPGVGGERRGLAVRSGDGRLFVGPDNGLLLLAAERLGGVEAAHELTSPRHRLEPVSATFHGRDVFAPAAAYLALGVDLAELGRALDARSLVRLELPVPDIDPVEVRATCLLVDRFGNVQLNVSGGQLELAGIRHGHDVDLELGEVSFTARVGATFAEVEHGAMIVYEDSAGSTAIACSGASAANALEVRAGDEIVIRKAGA